MRIFPVYSPPLHLCALSTLNADRSQRMRMYCTINGSYRTSCAMCDFNLYSGSIIEKIYVYLIFVLFSVLNCYLCVTVNIYVVIMTERFDKCDENGSNLLWWSVIGGNGQNLVSTVINLKNLTIILYRNRDGYIIRLLNYNYFLLKIKRNVKNPKI